MLINIYNLNPNQNAIEHCDSHLNKLILEGVQVLCDVNLELGFDIGYKHTRGNQKYKEWVLQSRQHYFFITDYIVSLECERFKRYTNCNEHRSYTLLKTMANKTLWLELPDVKINMDVFPKPKGYEHLPLCQAYQKYFNETKQHLAKWTNRTKPSWYKPNK